MSTLDKITKKLRKINLKSFIKQIEEFIERVELSFDKASIGELRALVTTVEELLAKIKGKAGV
jgi:hypothetical protein